MPIATLSAAAVELAGRLSSRGRFIIWSWSQYLTSRPLVPVSVAMSLVSTIGFLFSAHLRVSIITGVHETQPNAEGRGRMRQILETLATLK